MNKLVARFSDGHLIKGTALDFAPAKDVFHVTPGMPSAGAAPVAIHARDLKALFFVKDFEGDPAHIDRKAFACPPPAGARPFMVRMKDGEVLVGSSTEYQPGLPGLFLVPADSESNNLRCFLFAAAADEILFI